MNTGNPITWRENRSGCWICKSHKRSKYPQLRMERRNHELSRLIWELDNRREIPTGLMILHTCDEPRCINPQHLKLGTQADNIHDMVRKGRDASKIGENHYHHKLTWKQVGEIRKSYPRKTQLELAKEYGVSDVCIANVVNNKTWRRK